MSTSMPYWARFLVTSDHVKSLRDHGPGACLTWHEDTDQVEVAEQRELVRPSRMIIAGYHALDDLSENRQEAGRETTDDLLAEDLMSIGTDWLATWPQVRAMNLQLEEVRGYMADAGLYLYTNPTFELSTTGMPRIADYYRRTGGNQSATVRASFAFADPTGITIRERVDGHFSGAGLTLGTDRDLSHAATSNLIADTVISLLGLRH